MEAIQKLVRRPFHETIVDVIRDASTVEEFACLAGIIKITKIPKGHDEIIAAWQIQMKNFMSCSRTDFGVQASLIEQRLEADEKAKESVAEEKRTPAAS